ncbi:hypothetical protein RND81_07G049600 [Saponaria officinalis]|uniref:Uncharacterized protein n=1 Tax=Saponaria officinalis TaxID=3572 RepID=A0AAW1JQX8_SAPOF
MVDHEKFALLKAADYYRMHTGFKPQDGISNQIVTGLMTVVMGIVTLEDLKNESSLTKALKLGLQYFDDIMTRISRHEAAEMEKLLQNVGDNILPKISEMPTTLKRGSFSIVGSPDAMGELSSSGTTRLDKADSFCAPLNID